MTHLHLPFGSLAKISSKPKCINKSHVGVVIPITGQKSSPLSFTCCALSWSAQKSRKHISSLLQVNPDSCLCHNKLLGVCLQSRPLPIMHSAAGYRVRLAQNSTIFSLNWGGLRSDHVQTTNEPYQSLFVTRPRPPVEIGLGPVIFGCTQVQLLCLQLSKQTTPREKTNQFNSTKLKKAGMKTTKHHT